MRSLSCPATRIFVELVRHLKAEGVRVEIAAVKATTSRLLTDEADYFHEITSNDWFTLETKKPPRKKPGIIVINLTVGAPSPTGT